MKKIVVIICVALGLYMFFQTHGDNINSFVDGQIANYKAKNTSVFNKISFADLKRKTSAGESFVVYVDSSGCRFAKEFKPTLTQFLREEGYHIDNFSLDGITDWGSVRQVLGKEGSQTPSIYVFKKGRLVDRFHYERTNEGLLRFSKDNAFVFDQQKAVAI